MDDLFDVLIESGGERRLRGDGVSGVGWGSTHQVAPALVSHSHPAAVAEISPLVRLHPPSQEKPLAVTASITTLPVNTVLSRPPPMVHVAHPPQTLKLMEVLNSTMEVDFDDGALQQDNMDWLDLTLSVPAEGVASLDVSSPVGVFSPDFLESHELQLNWE